MREKQFGIWREWAWKEVLVEVRSLAIGLALMGAAKGDKIAILGANRPRLYWAMAAAQSIGCVPVPLYQDSVAEEIAYVLDHAEARIIICEDQEQVDKVLSMQGRLPRLTHIIYDDPRGLEDYHLDHVLAFDVLQSTGRTAVDAPGTIEQWLAGVEAGTDDALAVILYTSGTTGRPKGVMLSFRNVLVSAEHGNAFDRITETDNVIAYLPMAWAGDHIFSYAQSHLAGFCVNIPENRETILENRREISPTYFFSPPRVFEDFLTHVMVRMDDAGWFKRWLFRVFMAHAHKVGEPILDGKPVGVVDRLLYRLGSFFIYGPLKSQMGLSRLRAGYTAGEAIGPEIFRFYRSLGLNLKQLYGQTEACVYIALQSDGEVHSDTVGRAAPHMQIRIADDGEVLYRGAGVFVGYFKDERSTASAIIDDGWVRSGDAGFFDSSEQLKILDRIKDVGALADGKLFPPKYIENKLKFFSHVKEVVCFGNGHPFATAMINIDLVAVSSWAERNNISYSSYQELTAHPRVIELIAGHVATVNRQIANEPNVGHAQIRRFVILFKELDADDGELTRTHKVRRNIIVDRYAPVICALYDGSREIDMSVAVTFEDGRQGVLKGRMQIQNAETFGVAASRVFEHAA
ncbi:AMP-binding protein [Bradyrhizobium sp. 190]|nr:AMP-binding protein [Bradyrhizobium sp. 190]